MATYTSELDGHTETVPALPGSEEWEHWEKEMLAYRQECDSVRDEKLFEQSEYSLDYAIVRFRDISVVGLEKGEWLTNPPDDWEPRDAMERHGVAPIEDRRVAFVQLELLQYTWDFERIRTIAFPLGGERDTSPITKEEVGAALQMFRPGEGGAVGSLGSGSSLTTRQVADVNVRTGDASGRQTWPFTRRLVFLLTGK